MRTSSIHLDKKPKTLSGGPKRKDTEHKDTGGFPRHQGLGLGVISRHASVLGHISCVGTKMKEEQRWQVSKMQQEVKTY